MLKYLQKDCFMEPRSLNPQLEILYRDDFFVAVNKPAKMLVHRTEIANGDRVFALQCVRNMCARHVFPVHRLDRGTSGVLIFAFDTEAAAALGRAMMSAQVKKRYAALVRGWLESDVCVEHPLAPPVDPYIRHQKTEKQEAATVFSPVANVEIPISTGAFETTRLALVAAHLLTGRRHQIRRHLKWLAHPIVGDATYGKGPLNRALADYFGLDRLMLHCERIAFAHPITGVKIDISAPLESEFTKVLRQLQCLTHYEELVTAPWPDYEIWLKTVPTLR